MIRVSHEAGLPATFEAAKKCQSNMCGGRDAPTQAFGWTASITTYGSKHVCSGTIISAKRILTSARCMTDQHPHGIQIRVGSYNNRVGGQMKFVDSFRLHPDYNATTLQNDIAIINLRNSIDFSGGAALKIIQLPELFEAIDDDTTVVLSGWKPDSCNTNLRVFYNMTVISNANCNQFFRGGIVNTMFCAEVPTQFSALGFEALRDLHQIDFGGPVVDLEKQTLVGIVSWGHGVPCKGHRRPAVYTWVAYYREWITSLL